MVIKLDQSQNNTQDQLKGQTEKGDQIQGENNTKAECDYKTEVEVSF